MKRTVLNHSRRNQRLPARTCAGFGIRHVRHDAWVQFHRARPMEPGQVTGLARFTVRGRLQVNPTCLPAETSAESCWTAQYTRAQLYGTMSALRSAAGCANARIRSVRSTRIQTTELRKRRKCVRQDLKR